jgi:PRTRC genetic system protein B
LHEIIHDDKGAQLAAGQLMTVQMLADLMIGLGRSVPIEILPERVLVRTEEMIVWWFPGGEYVMFFSDRGNDPVLKEMNGKRYPQPPLLFKVRGNRLWVRALEQAERPNAETRMCVAPYWNCYDNGEVCTGSMKIPERSQWRQSKSGNNPSFKASSLIRQARASRRVSGAGFSGCGSRSNAKRHFLASTWSNCPRPSPNS